MVRRQREFDGGLRHLGAMRAFLREVCREGWQDEPADENLLPQLELALTEAASNIVLHGFDGRQDQPIGMTVEVQDDRVGLTLRYPGTPFDPEAAPPPVFDGSRESGFGLYLIRQCVDEVRYEQDDQGRSTIHLVRKRNLREPGADHAAPD
jgi:anti-sigma regulatory factor (Ser/Thr protein kinase)